MTDELEKLLLVPEPGGRADSPSVRRLLALAAGARFDVHVLGTVYEPQLQGYLGHEEVYESLRSRLVNERSVELQKLTDALRRRGIECTSQAVWGHPDQTIVNTAAEHEVDWVITAGVDQDQRFSHEDWQLIASCPVPLLLVRGSGAEAYRGIVAAVDPQQAHGKPPGLDEAILRHARTAQAVTSAQLAVVHCITPLNLFAPDPAIAGRTLDDVKSSVEAASRQALDALLEQAQLPVESGRTVHGAPETVLSELAERGEADLLVLGTLARGRIQSLVVGSTAQRVLRSTTRDVLLVPPPR